ncbi:MAG: protein kinase, partial [Anaerolineales bacterium]
LEAVILANLRHPNLPRVTDHFVVGDQGQYLVQDYIEGEDLRQRMERQGTIPEEEVILIGAAICDALTYLHTRKPPVLHRDIKPGNVKITPDGHVYLVDFGLAKVVQGSQVTTTGARAMTPGYSPPEQYGTARTDPRSDIYSLSATLYAALTGVIPEDGLARVMDNVQLTPIRKRNSNVSRRLAATIEKGMEPYPDDRFQSASEFKQALLKSSARTQQLTSALSVSPAPSSGQNASIASAAGIVEDSTPSVERKPSRPRRRKGKGGGGWLAFFALLLLVGGGYAAWMLNPSLGGYVAAQLPFLFPPTTTPVPAPTSTEALLVVDNATATEAPLPTATSTVGPTSTPVPPTATNTPASTPTPLISPTPIGGASGQIAFVSAQTGRPQIYLMSNLLDAERRTVQQITNLEDGACQPSWSPDGQRLVFVSPCLSRSTDYYRGSGLYIINADGSGLEFLTTSFEGNFEPAWSPNGKWIAYTVLKRVNEKPYTQIYLINLIDKSIRILAGDVDVSTYQAAWNPDGSQIAFSRLRFGASQIWYMRVPDTGVGSDATWMARSGDKFLDYLPAWSSDGFIYYTQKNKDNPNDLPRLMRIAYRDRGQDGAAGPINASHPPVIDADVSPDGAWIVYESSDGGGTTDIWLMSSGGVTAIQLTNDRADEFDPVWRPNGQVVPPAGSTGGQAAPTATRTP